MQLSSGVASAVAAGAATSHSESVNVASYALVRDGICVRVCVYRIASCAAPSCRVASFRRVPARAETGSVGLLIMFAPPSATTERQRASRARFARLGISNYPVHQLAATTFHIRLPTLHATLLHALLISKTSIRYRAQQTVVRSHL